MKSKVIAQEPEFTFTLTYTELRELQTELDGLELGGLYPRLTLRNLAEHAEYLEHLWERSQ